MQLNKVSMTSLQGYENCPHCWYLENVVGIERPESEALLEGIAAHNAIETWHKRGKIITGRGEKYVQAYRRTYGDDYWKEPCDIETYFKIKLVHPETGEDSGLMFSGKVDRITADGWLFDHKTAKSNWQQKKADEDKQASGYSLWYYLTKKKLPAGVTFNVLVKNKTIVCRPLTTYRDMNDLILVYNWMTMLADRIRNDEFEPNFGAWWHNYDQCPGNQK